MAWAQLKWDVPLFLIFYLELFEWAKAETEPNPLPPKKWIIGFTAPPNCLPELAPGRLRIRIRPCCVLCVYLVQSRTLHLLNRF